MDIANTMKGLTPILDVLKLTFRSLKSNANELFKRTGLWHLAYILTDVLSSYLFGIIGIDNYVALMSLGILSWVLWIGIWCVIAVKTHRVLVPSTSESELPVSAHEKAPYFIFFVRVIFLGVLFSVLLIPSFYVYTSVFYADSPSVIGICTILLTLTGLWFSSGFWISLPSIAIGKVMSLKQAYELSKPYRPLMFCIIAVFPFLYWLPLLAFDVLVENETIYSTLDGIVELVLTVLEIGLLSNAYRLLFNNKDRPFEEN